MDIIAIHSKGDLKYLQTNDYLQTVIPPPPSLKDNIYHKDPSL